MVGTTHHMLQLPKGIFILRCFQLATAVAILGLAAYGVTFVSFDGISLTLFTAIATMILTVYIIVSTVALTAAYNYWAILGLDIFAIIFWLISFSLLASEVAAWSSYFSLSYSSGSSDCTYSYAGVCYYRKRDLDLAKRYVTTDIYTYRNAMAAASGLGGLEFIFFIITLAFQAVYLHRHRKAGGHCTPNTGAVTTTGAPAYSNEHKDVELQGHPQQPAQYS